MASCFIESSASGFSTVFVSDTEYQATNFGAKNGGINILMDSGPTCGGSVSIAATASISANTTLNFVLYDQLINPTGYSYNLSPGNSYNAVIYVPQGYTLYINYGYIAPVAPASFNITLNYLGQTTATPTPSPSSSVSPTPTPSNTGPTPTPTLSLTTSPTPTPTGVACLPLSYVSSAAFKYDILSSFNGWDVSNLQYANYDTPFPYVIQFNVICAGTLYTEFYSGFYYMTGSYTVVSKGVDNTFSFGLSSGYIYKEFEVQNGDSVTVYLTQPLITVPADSLYFRFYLNAFSPSPSPTGTATSTPSPTVSPTQSATATPSPSPTPTLSASATPVPSSSPTPTSTPTPSGTDPTPSPTQSVSPTPTPAPTVPTPSPTRSPSPTPSLTTSPTPTATPAATSNPFNCATITSASNILTTIRTGPPQGYNINVQSFTSGTASLRIDFTCQANVNILLSPIFPSIVCEANYRVGSSGLVLSVPFANGSPFSLNNTTFLNGGYFEILIPERGVATIPSGNALGYITFSSPATPSPTISPTFTATPTPTPTITGQATATNTPQPTPTPLNAYLWSFGYNYWGQLGDNGAQISSSQPVQTTYSTAVWRTIGHSHSDSNAAIKNDGTFWTWGRNTYGSLGLGNSVSASTPTQVLLGGNDWVFCASNVYNTIAIKADGSLWSCGQNAYGQMGTNNTTNSSLFLKVKGSKLWKNTVAGKQSFFAIAVDGSLWSCGSNAYGQLGNSSAANASSIVQVGIGYTWLDVDSDNLSVVAIRSDNTLWCWGSNSAGQLGQNVGPLQLANTSSPVQIVSGGFNWISCSTGYGSVYGIKNDGTLWCWGLNNSGQLGDSTTINRSSPVQVVGTFSNTWVSVQAGIQHATGLQSDGSLYSWGRNDRAQLGPVGTSQNCSTPVFVNTPGLVWQSVSGGFSSTSMLTENTPPPTATSTGTPTGTPTATANPTPTPTPSGTGPTPTPTITPAYGYSLYNWGSNSQYQIGNNKNSTTAELLPVQTTVIGNQWQNVFCGINMGAGIKTDYTLWVYGSNYYGNLGITPFTAYQIVKTPVQVAGGGEWQSVDIGFTSLGIKRGGSLWGWGLNNSGQVGDSTTTNRTIPTFIGNGFSQVAAAIGLSAAINNSGQLFLWGNNSFGAIGDGTTTSYSSPVQELTNSTWLKVAVGYSGLGCFTAAIKSDNTLWLWGVNNLGQLGQDNLTAASSPIQEITNSLWVDVATGYGFFLAIKKDGTIWGCGSNNFGQLGNNDIISVSSPIQNIDLNTNWLTISCGYRHAIATRSGSTQVWGWGDGANAALGQNNFISYSSPVQLQSAFQEFIGIFPVGGLWYSATAGGYNSAGLINIVLSPTPTSTASPTPTSTPTPSGTDPSPTPTPSPSSTDPSPTPTSTPSPTPETVLWMFGDNYFGQLGNDSQVDSKPIVKTYYPTPDWNYIACAKGYQTFAIKYDGSLWSWGDNAYGQLGVGNVVDRSIPTQEITLSTWTKVQGGVYHTAAIKKDGTLWSWGGNSYGDLGANISFSTLPSVSSPIQECTSSQWVDVACGFDFTLGVKTNGTLWGWGSNKYCQIGDGRDPNLYPAQSSPTQEYYSAISWKKVYATAFSSAGIKADGSLWCWGNGYYGTIGNNTNQLWSFPQPVDIDTAPLPPTVGWALVSGGFNHMAGIKSDYSLWLWGRNNAGQLGDGTVTTRSSPVQVLGSGAWIGVSAGYNFTVAIKFDGSLWSWGENTNYSLGNIPFSTNVSSPVQVDTGGLTWGFVSAGYYHSGLLTRDPDPTPSPTTSASPTPTPSNSLTPTPTITPSPSPTVAPMPPFVTVGGNLFLAGSNAYGQIGDNTTTSRSSVVQTIAGGTDWNNFSLTFTNAAAVKDDGSLWCWGQNTFGALGDNSTTSVSSPQQTITTTTDWFAVSTGYFNTFAIKQDGTLWGWGYNQYGKLGDITTDNKSSPIQIMASYPYGWLSVSTGYDHSAAISLDGTLWTWGHNSFGDLGNNSTINSSSPVQTSAQGLDWVQVSCGAHATYALKKDGSVWAWGRNVNGEFGNLDVTNTSTPVFIGAGQKYWSYISGGQNFAAALSSELIPTPTSTPSPTVTTSPSPTPSPNPTNPTPTPSGTQPTPTPTITVSPTLTPGQTGSPTATPSPTVTQEPTPTPTIDPARENSLSIWYRIFSVYQTSLELYYQLGGLITWSYRVETECRPLEQPLAPFSDPAQNCPSRTILTIFGTSVTDVCEQMRAIDYITKVKSIQRYSKPVYSLEEEYLISLGNYNPAIVTWINEPFCQYPACADLCVDYIMEEFASCAMQYFPEGSMIFGGGVLNLGGSARVICSTQSSIGYLALYGTAGVTTSGDVTRTYSYTGSGNLEIYGTGTSAEPTVLELIQSVQSFETVEGLNSETIIYVQENELVPILNVPVGPQNVNLCKCKNIPLQLLVSTNFDIPSNFMNFINRNNLVFNPNLYAIYNSLTRKYTNSFVYVSPYEEEKWTIIVDINCDNDLDNFDIEPVWTATFMFRRYLPNGLKLDTVVDIWIPASQFCPINASNTITCVLATNVISNPPSCVANNNYSIENIFINDGAGLFKSQSWNINQILNIQIFPANG
jgi:alpha-tubulin suppressor-like RCC1 family protein